MHGQRKICDVVNFKCETVTSLTLPKWKFPHERQRVYVENSSSSYWHLLWCISTCFCSGYLWRYSKCQIFKNRRTDLFNVTQTDFSLNLNLADPSKIRLVFLLFHLWPVYLVPCSVTNVVCVNVFIRVVSLVLRSSCAVMLEWQSINTTILWRCSK